MYKPSIIIPYQLKRYRNDTNLIPSSTHVKQKCFRKTGVSKIGNGKTFKLVMSFDWKATTSSPPTSFSSPRVNQKASVTLKLPTLTGQSPSPPTFMTSHPIHQ